MGTIDKNKLTYEELLSFTDTTSTTCQLNQSASNFDLLIVRLRNSDQIVGTATSPTIMYRNLEYRVYGESSSQWGSFNLQADMQTCLCNRTASNTTALQVVGVRIG